MSDTLIVVLIGGGTLLANLAILALNLKLYTEYFKAEDQRKRQRGE